eukprot:9487329-Karenia_brevis.AAC.1
MWEEGRVEDLTARVVGQRQRASESGRSATTTLDEDAENLARRVRKATVAGAPGKAIKGLAGG